MKSNLLLVVALVVFSCQSSKPKPIDAAMLTEAEVKDFITAYDKAWERRDTVAMKEIMDDKYIYFSSTGNTTRRDNIISWFTPADKYKMDTAYRNEISVILNGNTAIVNTHWVGNGTFGEEKFDDDQRCGLVVQKLNGKLKIISEHCVQIEKK
jgi:ketosteroid isomerase-like protein